MKHVCIPSELWDRCKEDESLAFDSLIPLSPGATELAEMRDGRGNLLHAKPVRIILSDGTNFVTQVWE